MRAFRLRRAFVLATLLLANQSLIPILHEWRVGLVESSFHHSTESTDPDSAVSDKNAHKHHTETDCAFCLLLSRGGSPLHTTTRLHPRGAPRAADLPPLCDLTQSPALPGAPPRGPPALA
ncbi:MAG: hypothetical protein AUJ52_07335 [Elusimicrobia bacterium CG1_02_63_36]|nr:MAG: hypothetical protein AUJ52_07335 [Elusimicrobia bacterium CG1_02_63_36]PIP83676.1 MAG: hypothetical protein COR54_08220 [Elusimicrobia bacterium CG22_combo_CG10-13_8_21_14_all_63_91]PJA15585.1 MAG: hypothetical protein COX66_09700 [Elusimicrobia bacterium CG_4_10_14_0_2_um_filter_63_34]PJB26518.1 MAG: hypothetical protein CO113_03090 [Elusimicrobia bacterium CG_4_9_14_3_um_filter_62_55]